MFVIVDSDERKVEKRNDTMIEWVSEWVSEWMHEYGEDHKTKIFQENDDSSSTFVVPCNGEGRVKLKSGQISIFSALPSPEHSKRIYCALAVSWSTVWLRNEKKRRERVFRSEKVNYEFSNTVRTYSLFFHFVYTRGGESWIFVSRAYLYCTELPTKVVAPCTRMAFEEFKYRTFLPGFSSSKRNFKEPLERNMCRKDLFIYSMARGWNAFVD